MSEDFYNSEFAREFRAGFARRLEETGGDLRLTIPADFDVDVDTLREQVDSLNRRRVDGA